MKQNDLITIVGATAIGKTDLSIKLAKHFHTEIVSSDSRQFYKEMQIGTAVPTPDELEQAKHYFIQNRSICEDYNVGAFEKDTIALLERLFKKREVLIMVGGSGLYVDAVLNGLDSFPPIDPTIRDTLKAELKENGIKPLQKKLLALDPVAYQTIDIQNKQRLLRALEICIGSNRPFSYFLNKNKKKRNFSNIKIGITADREMVYDRINKRVDLMIENGLIEEAKTLYPHRELNALQTVGYKELFRYFDEEITLEFAISEIKKNSRRFAKRQGTWFRKDTEIKWFDYQENTEVIIQYIEKKLNP